MNALLDLSILDAGDAVIAIGRRGSDVAIGRLLLDAASIGELEGFRDRLDRAVRGAAEAPPPEEIGQFGDRLFEYAIRDDLADLYRLLPATLSRIHILSNQGRIQRLPWEYLTFPQHAAGHPVRERSVVRIVPTRGREAPEPKPLSEAIRVLFVSAAPRDQNEVDFEAVKSAIQRTFQSLMPERSAIEVVDGATRSDLRKAVAERSFDILHFSGHGRVDEKGRGKLLLVNRKTAKTDELGADELGALLSGRDLRLVVLSACESATGDFTDDFAVTAEALVRSGIPAVVANQLPVTNRAMANFVGPLYTELLGSGDIDRAVLEGRIALDIDLQSFEWGIPTLYRHYGASQLYQPTSAGRSLDGARAPSPPRRPGRAKVQAVGFWDLASQVGELPRVIEALNASQEVFRFSDVQAAVSSGLVSRPERVVAWAQERMGRRLAKREAESIGNNVIFEDFSERAKAVRKSLGLDYLIGVVPAKVAFDEDGGLYWNYFAIEEEKISLVSTYGVYAYARQAKRPFEVAVAGIALSNLLACFNPKVEFHEETRGCLFDFNRHRDSIVEMLRETKIEPSCLALMAPRYREAAAAMSRALAGLGELPKPPKASKPPKKEAPEPAAAEKESSSDKPAARPRARVARK